MKIDFLLARLPDYATINRTFTFACAALPGPLGSAVSFVYHGGAIWCTAQVLSGRRPLSTDPAMVRLTIAIFAYVAANLFSTMVNGGPHLFRSILPIVAFLGFPFSYSIWTISRKSEVATALVFGSALCCFGALLLAVVQFHILHIRAEGGAGNALVFAMVTCMACAITFAGFFYVDKRWSLLLGGAAAAGLIAMIYSGSRLTWFALAIDAALVLVAYRRPIRARLTRKAFWRLTALAVVVCAIVAIPIAKRSEILITDWQELAEKGDYSTSLGVRAALWQIGMDHFREAPAIGYGQAMTSKLIREGLQSRYGISYSYTHFHNGFLTAAVESGILGLIALVAIFVLAIKTAIDVLRGKPGHTEKIGAITLLVAAATYICVGSGNLMLGHDILDTMFLFMLAAGTYLAAGTSTLHKGV